MTGAATCTNRCVCVCCFWAASSYRHYIDLLIIYWCYRLSRPRISLGHDTSLSVSEHHLSALSQPEIEAAVFGQWSNIETWSGDWSGDWSVRFSAAFFSCTQKLMRDIFGFWTFGMDKMLNLNFFGSTFWCFIDYCIGLFAIKRKYTEWFGHIWARCWKSALNFVFFLSSLVHLSSSF